jgi:hypothetical protein
LLGKGALSVVATLFCFARGAGKKKIPALRGDPPTGPPSVTPNGKLSDTERAAILTKRKQAAQKSRAKLAEEEGPADAAIKSGTYKPSSQPLIAVSELPFCSQAYP